MNEDQAFKNHGRVSSSSLNNILNTSDDHFNFPENSRAIEKITLNSYNNNEEENVGDKSSSRFECHL